MLAETVAQWRREAVEEGRRRGLADSLSRQRAMLRRMAALRFGVATGDALAELLANEEDVERIGQVGELVVGCGSAQELLRRSRDLLNRH